MEESTRYSLNSQEAKSLYKSLGLTVAGFVALQIVQLLPNVNLGPMFNQIITLSTPFLLNTLRLWLQGKTPQT